MTNRAIALAISAICFGLVIGFLTGYAVRAYISFRHRHPNYEGWASGASDAFVAASRDRHLRGILPVSPGDAPHTNLPVGRVDDRSFLGPHPIK